MDIATNLQASAGKRAEWLAGVIAYEKELEASGGRVSKMEKKFKPPVIIKGFRLQTHRARMILPNFWPEDVYKKAKGCEVPADIRDSYTFKGTQLFGCYLDPHAHPAIAGVITLAEVEETGFGKEQEIANTSTPFEKGRAKEVWQALQADGSHTVATEDRRKPDSKKQVSCLMCWGFLAVGRAGNSIGNRGTGCALGACRK